MALVQDLSGNGGFSFSALPHDWTEGTGVIPAGGSITVADPTAGGGRRKWLYIQNQGVAVMQILYKSVTASGVASTVTVALSPGPGGVGSQGGADERNEFGFIPIGPVVILGTAGDKVCVLEVLR